jgi:DnaK suppressor protein
MKTPLEDLTSAQNEELHAQLLALRQELKELLELSVASTKPVALDEPIGRLSRMDAMQQQSMAVANRNGAKRRQQLVDAALRRIGEGDYGDYGDCLECGEPVGYRRLNAAPEVGLCVNCQSQLETRS